MTMPLRTIKLNDAQIDLLIWALNHMAEDGIYYGTKRQFEARLRKTREALLDGIRKYGDER